MGFIMTGTNHFDVFDYLVVFATLLIPSCIGMYYAFMGKQTKEEMLVGGRNMKVLPIAASMLVTYFSAISMLGYPAEIYSYGAQIYVMTIVDTLFIPLSTLIYVKVLYQMKLTSVYEYLEGRFNSIWVRWFASFTFILQIILINAVILYAPAIALEAIVGLPIWISVTGIGIIGTIYTSLGGLKAVVWTDVFQFFMIMIGMLSIVTKGFIKAGGFSKAFNLAYERGRLNLFDFTVDPFMRHNTLNFLLGYGFSVLSHGTHQPQVQRYSSLPTLRDAIIAVLLTIPLKLFTFTIILFTGISVTATYADCCPILLGQIKKADAIIPYFVVEELAVIPGMMGVFVACVFSAVLSTFSSTLNSLAAVTWEDFLSKCSIFKNLRAKGQGQWTKLLVLIYGILSVFLALGAQNLGSIFQVAMTAVGATSGPLGGTFLLGLFVPFTNKYGAIGGILTGLSTMMFISVNALGIGKQYDLNPHLPTSLTDCPNGTDFSSVLNVTMSGTPDLEFPEKLYTLSYILCPFVGAIITGTVGILISILTGGLKGTHKFGAQYIHPWIREAACVRPFLYKSAEGNSATAGKELAELMTTVKYPNGEDCDA